MASYTENYKLVKPELTDNITPTIFADNFDIIDKAMTDTSKTIKSVLVTLTASGWTGDSEPYSQSVAVSGMTADWVPGVPLIVATDIAETNLNMRDALNCVTQITSASGMLTFVCYEEKPEHDMTIRIPGVMV